MKVNLYKYYKDAPPKLWGKGLFILGGIALGIGVWFLGKSIVRRIQHQKELRGQRQAVTDSSDQVKVLVKQGQGPSYPDAQYSAWASAIQTAFDGCDPFNDDTGAVMNAFNGCKNDADVYKLISVFGIRKWDACGWWTGDTELDLVGGIRSQLSVNEIAVINKVLAGKGISYRF